MPNRILISPLCHRTLGKSLRLLHQAFPHPPFIEHPAIALPYSLIPDSIKLAIASVFQVTMLQYWIAHQNDTVIGIIGLYGWRSQPSILWVGWFCVDPTWQRQGIGSQLLHWAVDRAKRFNKSQLLVYTFANANQALRLYERIGFSVMDTSGRIILKLELN